MMNHPEQDKAGLPRREALKILAAAGSAIALSTLPETWEKPVVINGALPAFAQTSPTATPDLGTPPTLSNCSLSGPIGSCDSGGGQSGRIYLVTCDYADPDGNVLPNEARVRVRFTFPSGSTSAQEAALDPINLTGDGFNGAMTLPFCINFGSEASVDLTISLLDANRLESNLEMINISAPNPITTNGATGPPRGKIAQ